MTPRRKGIPIATMAVVADVPLSITTFANADEPTDRGIVMDSTTDPDDNLPDPETCITDSAVSCGTRTARPGKEPADATTVSSQQNAELHIENLMGSHQQGVQSLAQREDASADVALGPRRRAGY